MNIKNKITIGVLDNNLVAQVEHNGAGPMFEVARPWLVLDLVVPDATASKQDLQDFASSIGELVAAQVLTSVANDDDLPRKKVIMSDKEVFDRASSWTATWPASQLTKLPGVGPSRAAKLVKKMIEQNIIVQTTSDDATHALFCSAASKKDLQPSDE